MKDFFPFMCARVHTRTPEKRQKRDRKGIISIISEQINEMEASLVHPLLTYFFFCIEEKLIRFPVYCVTNGSNILGGFNTKIPKNHLFSPFLRYWQTACRRRPKNVDVSGESLIWIYSVAFDGSGELELFLYFPVLMVGRWYKVNPPTPTLQNSRILSWGVFSSGCIKLIDP